MLQYPPFTAKPQSFPHISIARPYNLLPLPRFTSFLTTEVKVVHQPRNGVRRDDPTTQSPRGRGCHETTSKQTRARIPGVHKTVVGQTLTGQSIEITRDRTHYFWILVLVLVRKGVCDALDEASDGLTYVRPLVGEVVLHEERVRTHVAHVVHTGDHSAGVGLVSSSHAVFEAWVCDEVHAWCTSGNWDFGSCCDGYRCRGRGLFKRISKSTET